MSHAEVAPIHDAVHGPIYLNQHEYFDGSTWLQAVLQAPAMRRLKRIQQLPFASSEFLAADHTRYAHAIGTAHMVMCLLRQLRDADFFDEAFMVDLRRAQNGFGGGEDSTLSYFGSHLVLAGLLQDLGELPYKTATDLFLYPEYALHESLADEFGVNALSLTGKDVFTLHAVKQILQSVPESGGHLSFPLLGYLISGVRVPGIGEHPSLKSLRMLVDGPVDADRLDYVHRDAYHTLGQASGSSARAVVASLRSLHASGPVFDSPGPVSDFIVLRAVLRFQVYSSPASRFRYTLLAKVLSEAIGSAPDWVSESLGTLRGALSFESFLTLDDNAVLDRLLELATKSGKASLSPTSRKAIEILHGGDGGYRHYWLDEPAGHPGEGKDAGPPEQLPLDILVDTYWDEERHRLYEPNSIRIDQSAYSLAEPLVPLETTGGHISEMLQTIWDSPPVQGKLLLFVPPQRAGWLTRQMSSEPSRAAAYGAALDRDAATRLGVDDDTRATPGFGGPVIFVSFSWAQVNLTRAVLRILHGRRRRYLAFVGAFHGLGTDTRENGRRSAIESDAALVILSRRYIESALDPKSNISAELAGLSTTGRAKAIAFLAGDAGDDFDAALKMFPWQLLDREFAPFLGSSVVPSNVFALERAVEAALAAIDNWPGNNVALEE